VSPGAEITGSPFSINSSTPNGTITITGLAEGYYLVTEINLPAGYTPDVNPQIVAVHAGDVGTGNPVTVTFNNRPTELTALAPTQTTCTEFANGQALPQEDETYGLRNGVIRNVSPGVFFFYASYTVTNTPLTLSVDAVERFNSTTIDPTNITNDWVVTQGQAFLYRFANGTCTKLTAGVTTQISGGQVVITLDPAGTTPVPNGTYILGIKYTNSASLIGSAPCHGGATPCNYYFIPSRDGTELTARAQALLFRRR
jgi:Prealbumin-like fold domain